MGATWVWYGRDYPHADDQPFNLWGMYVGIETWVGRYRKATSFANGEAVVWCNDVASLAFAHPI